MSLGRLLLFALALALGYLAYRSYTGSRETPAVSSSSPGSPIDKAREVARAGDARREQTDAVSKDSDSMPGGAVTENMTPDQVRALLGPPDDTARETTDSGVTRERWTYRAANKVVVFDNGIVTRIE